MALVMPFVVAMVVTIAWLPVFGRVAARWRIVDHPGHRKVHATPIPRIGGVAMAIGVLVAAIIVVPLQPSDRYFLAAAGTLTVFGVLDDRFDLDYRVKLLGQVLAAGIVIFAGDIQIHSITLDDRVMLPSWVSVPLTLVFLVGVTNAINLADGLDGLAGGTTFLCLCALAMLAYSVGQLSCAALALAFAGAVLGFLRFNTYPASIFMGDAGSQLLGFAVGVLSLRATQSGNSVVSAATPILLLALPILDTLSVMVQRVGEGRSPFSPDKNHIHHKLLGFGLDHHEAVMVIYAVQADLFLLAYWLRFESDLTILGVVSAFFLASITMLQVARRARWRLRSPRQQKRESPVGRMLTLLREPQRLPRWSYYGVVAGVWGYAAIVTTEAVRVSMDVRLLLLALLAVTVVWLLILRGKPLSTVERAALYITAAIFVYLDSVLLHDRRVATPLIWAAVLIMALGTVLRLRLKADRRFELTPLDLIVLFVALVLPSLSGSLGLPDGGAAGIAKLVILFYAIEALLSRTETRVVWFRISAATLLAGLIVRPML
ncbi:MAG TPA: MraY family glycosyltransferase [Steroidobacteraceae bacterium]|jgi:UDP-GlcNAc:undecaprenyl-phosphate GlcNAc-1-phosphate transferase|nr:MraY family glycosyltransferase [Steroidobacteraceae bacterium]